MDEPTQTERYPIGANIAGLATPVRESEISREVQGLRQTQKTLVSITEELIMRLSGVLSPTEEVESAKSPEVQGPSTLLACNLNEINHDFQRTVNILKATIKAIEL